MNPGDQESSGSASKREERLSKTLAELALCLNDAAQIVGAGRRKFDEDMVSRRAAKNVISELSETLARLPDGYLDARTGPAWHEIRGMRNLVVHEYQQTDFQVVWDTLAQDFPDVRRALDL